MPTRLIRWSIENRLLVVIATLIIMGWGWMSAKEIPLDAIPDLSDVQVIVFTEYPGQAPQVVEDQVTYPLTTAMLSVPQATHSAKVSKVISISGQRHKRIYST